MLSLIWFPFGLLCFQVNLVIFTHRVVAAKTIDGVILWTMNKLIHGDLIIKLTSHRGCKIFKIYGPGFLLDYVAICSSNDQHLVTLRTDVRPPKGCKLRGVVDFDILPLVQIWVVFFSDRLDELWPVRFFTRSSSWNASEDIDHIIEDRESKVCSWSGHSLQAMPPHIHLAFRVQSDLREWVEQKLKIVTNDGSRVIAFWEILSKFSTDYKESRLTFILDDTGFVHESSGRKILALIRMAHSQLWKAFFFLNVLYTIHEIWKCAIWVDTAND